MKRFANIWARSLVLGIALALGLPQVAGAQPAPPSDPLSVFGAYVRALSAGDVEGALALFAEDAVLTITPPPPGTSGHWEGKAEIREQLIYGRENSVRSEPMGAPQIEGNKVTVRLKVTNKFFVEWGVAPVQFTAEAVIENGKLKSFTNTMDPSERERVAAAARAYEQAQSAQLPGGMPRTGSEAGPMLFLLLLGLGALAAIAGVGLRRDTIPKIG
jgi:hypothetical protein